MKSIVQQYRDLNEGKMSKANFMTNVRRQFPDWISSVNSYQDAISILKNKRILSEADIRENSKISDVYNELGHVDPFKMGVRDNEDGKSLRDCPFTDSHRSELWKNGWSDAETKGQIDYDRAQWYKEMSEDTELNEEDSMTVSSAIEHVFDGDFDGNELKLMKARELVNTSNHPDKAVTLQMIDKKLEDAMDAEAKGQMNRDKAQWGSQMTEDMTAKQKKFAALAPPKGKITYADKIAGAKLKKEEVSMEGKKPFYLVSDSGEIVDSTMAEDETEARQYFENEYEGVGSSMTIIHTNNPDEIGDVYAEESLNEGRKRGRVNEAKEENEGYYKHVTGKDLYSVFDEIDRVNPYEFKRGINIEMGMQYKPTPKYFTPEFNPETLEKATKKVLKNLEKDPAYYTNMISAEFEKKSGLKQHPKELKVGPDALTKIKGFSDAKSNTQTNQSKKERAKGGPEGVKEMKPSKRSMGGIKTMKSNEKLPKGVELMKESSTGGGDYTFNGHFKAGELAKLKQQIPDAEIDTDTEEGQSVKTTVMSKKYNEKTIQQAVNNATGMGKSNEFPIKGQMMEDKKAQQLKKIKESIAKKIKEDLFSKGGQTVTASTTQSQSKLKQMGYQAVPNTKDINKV